MGLAPNVSASASAAGGSGSYRDAIASIESKGSGDYSAIGPTNAKLGRPLGRYQVMEANIGPWSKEALGREVSVDEFLANPKIQDAVFDHKFNGYVQQFGPEGAAQAWFAGPGGVGKVDRKDVLGTDVGTYGNKFMAALGPQGQPQQVASLDPSIGMPPGPQAAPMQGPPMPSLSDEVAEFKRTPEYAARFPGQNVGGSAPPAPPLAPPVEVAAPAVPPTASPMGQQAAPQQIAQAQPQQQSGPDQATLYQILTHPFSTPEQKAVAQMMLEQQAQQAGAQREQQVWMQRQQYETEQKRSDPSYQLGLKKTQAELDQMGKPEYRTLTPEERKQYGIPDNDQRLYQVSRGGKVDAVGGAGQTINVGNEIDARKAAAAELGLSPEDPRYESFVLTGKFPREDSQSLTATDKKAILEADEMVAANQSALDALSQAEGLSDKANSGWFAGARASIGNNLPDWMVPDQISSPESSQATTDMDNAIIGQAITQLKTIFGGNPTEGERNILLELQGSSTMPREVRKQVFSRARALAEKRLQFNNDRATDLRGGTYYKPDRAPATGQNIDDLLKKYGAP
ncbi:hypothetical protein [Sinorhizobium meliloti]|nr:hypothetical protein [Sinorhizobium meliloti]MDE4621743.1 hypothetical protein [Sinorhizobium meliloti]